MKKKLLVTVLLFVVTSAHALTAPRDCSLEAEELSGSTGYTQPGQFAGYEQNGNLIYLVRANENGGDVAYEVVVTPSCEFVSRRTLWSE